MVGRCLVGRWKYIPTERCAAVAANCYPRLGLSWVTRSSRSSVQRVLLGQCIMVGGSIKWRKSMKKRVYFDVFRGPGWPSPSQLEPYFLTPPGQRWTFDTGNDIWGLA